jgi:hypothetical protein
MTNLGKPGLPSWNRRHDKALPQKRRDAMTMVPLENEHQPQLKPVELDRRHHVMLAQVLTAAWAVVLLFAIGWLVWMQP